MPPLPSCPTPVRPSAVVNAAIRAVVVRAQGRPWREAEKALYALLLEEWADAVQAEEMTTAA